MKKINLKSLSIAVGLSMTACVLAKGSDLSEAQRLCLFRKPLELGSSITARTPELPFYQTYTKYAYSAGPFRYYGSPSMFFIDHYRALDSRFRSTSYQIGVNKKENFSVYKTPRGFSQYLGAGQVHSFLYGKKKHFFDSASVIFGVDLFSHDVDSDSMNCGFGVARTQAGLEGRVDSEAMIIALIGAVKKSGKIVFLGNIPEEDSKLIKIKDWWVKPDLACANSINNILNKYCTVANNCYLVNLKNMVDKIKNGESLFVEKMGRSFGYDELRPDGLHVSEAGATYLFEKMRENFENNPPNICR